LTGMVTSVPPSETFNLIINNILHQSKNYENHFENSNFWGMWPLGYVVIFPPQDNRGQNNEQFECLLRPWLFIPTVPV
jgi:hypothetical protein